MPTVIWDIETFSDTSLKELGSHIYAMRPSTGVHFLCFAVDNGEVETWRPGDPVPEPFANPSGFTFVSFNWAFENAILRHVLIPRYGFVPIPWASQDCAMRLALANAYPAELGLCCEALGLPYRKDPEARKAMLRLSRPQTAKKRKKPVDPAQRERDLALLLGRCKSDVEATRAVYRSPLLRPLPPQEREQLLLDAEINQRGIRANIPFLEAVRDLAVKERNAVNLRLNELTAGVVTSVDQVQRIKAALVSHGHQATTLGKRSVAATLAHDPDDYVRELLQLRQQGAYASVRMAKRLLGRADPSDGRIRDGLRIYGAGPGRWSSPGAQLHNLKRNDTGYPGSLVATVTAGDRAGLAAYGNPLEVAAGLSRAALCAKPGHVLICADFGAIESRILSWFAGEVWKLDAYRHYDATGDKSREPYRVIAGRMLGKDPGDIVKAERQQGKCAELACGFGGSIGAWRKIAGDDGRDDAEVMAIIAQWRNAHQAIRAFWRSLAFAARSTISTGLPTQVGGGSRPAIVAASDGNSMTLMLPSGRAIVYPGARLVPNRKFEDGDSDIEFHENSRGQWKRARAWFGTLVENVVQATARDLLAAALLRFEARGLSVIFHCHDEVVIEAPEGAVTADEVLAILLEPPAWASGLPLGGKVYAAPTYFEEPDNPVLPKDTTAPVEIVEQQIDTFVASAEPLPATRGIEQGAEDDYLAGLDDTAAPLTELVTLLMDSSNRVACPFHDDPNPSCSIYPDHFYCHGCGARGTRLEWLIEVEGMTRAEALAALQDWTGPATTIVGERPDPEARRRRALALWDEAGTVRGTIGERYLAGTRGIDVSKLPPTVDEVLRFHRHCPFGAGAHPCLVALMRSPETDAPVGIQRIALALENGAVTKIERRAFGGMGVVKLWSVDGARDLTVGEGVETVLAAVTRMSFEGAPLTPAWAAVHTHGVATLPVLDGVARLIQLVDNDENNAGQAAAETSRQRWSARGRAVVPLMPPQVGWDWNDIVLGRRA